jgi:pimeloyl-ACP methyl ester carboxylesterase
MPKVQANGIQLEYETFGKASNPAILLIMGLGGQMILWPEEFCRELADGGFHVIRYDNRDVGLSTHIAHARRANLMQAGFMAMLGLPVRAPYTLKHMTDDAVGLMDALKLPGAHVVGASMGGMIAQTLAAHHGHRVKTLTSIMSTSGSRRLPGPSLKIRMRLISRPEHGDRESLIRHSMQTWRMIGSPRYPASEAELRRKVERSFDRAHYPAGLARQLLAIMASGSRTQILRHITAPTLVIHGEQDPLIPVAAAYELARRIPNAHMELIPGMGHDLPAELLPAISGMILAHTRRAA